ncbi:MAG: hypothetical protein QOC54_2233, partial [Baekduia sp.]|nr:hypothetical protein [Baekduia sp.]
MIRRAAVLAALAAAWVATGCAGSRDEAPTTPADPAPQQPLQIANGPVAPPAATSPLTLALTGAPDPVQIKFHRPPRAGLLFDLDTGRVLWRKDPTRVLPIASVTKMMTALVVVDRVPQGAKVRVTKEALHYQGSGVGLLPRGK